MMALCLLHQNNNVGTAARGGTRKVRGPWCEWSNLGGGCVKIGAARIGTVMMGRGWDTPQNSSVGERLLGRHTPVRKDLRCEDGERLGGWKNAFAT
jgi:hypothetical protein